MDITLYRCLLFLTILNFHREVLMEKRCYGLKKRMLKDDAFRADYVTFMKSLFEKGYAEEVGKECHEQGWFIPHHGVYHPVKEKIRVVFNCAEKVDGVSLNDNLLSGPDLTNSLLGVIWRFRTGLVPFMVDIESMFCQVHVPKAQQRFLRFWWWPDGDLTKGLQMYQMKVHVFGATSSPSCANFALRKTADENVELCGHAAAETLKKNFYVDDMLKSTDSVSSATQLIREVVEMCKMGGFNLTKFVSSNPSVLSNLPDEKKASSMKEENLPCPATIERALGVVWSVENDSFGFHIEMKDSPLTRRGILSTVSSVFDPLGIASPFVLEGRRILQAITAEQRDWDAPVSDDHACRWRKWRERLVDLKDLCIPRCYKNTPHPIIDATLHSFSDASENGYGEATYMRQVDVYGNVCVSLAVAKSRVAPLKEITIPRLELVAAVTSVNVTAMVKRELDLEGLKEEYWTDSKIVLGYICNETKRFKTFVANRVEKIRSQTKPSQWRYVSTLTNPADCASRGITMRDEEKVKLWLNGPAFLQESLLRDQCEMFSVSDDDLEIKKSIKVNLTSCEQNIMEHLASRVSSWSSMKRIIAFIIRFVQRCRGKPFVSEALTVDELEKAEIAILKGVQQSIYASKFPP